MLKPLKSAGPLILPLYLFATVIACPLMFSMLASLTPKELEPKPKVMAIGIGASI